MTAQTQGLTSAVTSVGQSVRIEPLHRLSMGGKWRTEAMRSYSRPVLIWFTRGQGRITVQGVTRGYGPHNAVFLPAGTMHGFEMMGQVHGQMVFLPNAGNLEWPEVALHLRIRDGRRQAELTAMLETLEREIATDGTVQNRALYFQTGLLSVLLERFTVDPEPSTPRTSKAKAADKLAAAFTSLVERDFRTAKAIGDYAADLGVTPTHLTRACRHTCGRGALQIVGDRKLYEARKRLTEEVVPVAQIAEDLGFGSAAYFTRHFRSETGMTPTQFRKNSDSRPNRVR